MEPKEIAAIKAILAEQTTQAERLNAAALEAFPIGSETVFLRGRGAVCAEILAFSRGTRTYAPSFRIRNRDTGKEYWVELYWLMQTSQ